MTKSMIQFELDNSLDMHQHWLRDRRFGGRIDFTGRTIENLIASYRDFSNAIFDDAVIRNTNFTDSNLTNLIANGTHFDGCNFTGTNFRNAHLQRALFTDCTVRFRNTDLWQVTGNGTQIISLQLGGNHIVYTGEILQIGCKQYRLPDVWQHDKAEFRVGLQSYSEEEFDELFEWWDDWKITLQQIIHKHPADPNGIKTIYPSPAV